jgi:proline iminopeptidase
MVAMAYATRHPDHPSKLILVSTSAQGFVHPHAKVAMFARLGGPEAGDLARRRFIDGETTPELLARWRDLAIPLYTRTKPDPARMQRTVLHPAVIEWFNRPGGEGGTFDLLGQLGGIRCPTLVLGGTLDPMTPIECQRDLAAAIPRALLQYREFEACGHAVVPDAAGAALDLIRRFIGSPER